MNKKLILGMLLIAGSAIEANMHVNDPYEIKLKLLKKSKGYIKALKAADEKGAAAFNAAMAAFYQTPTGIKYKKAQTVLKANIGTYDAALNAAREHQKEVQSGSIEGTKEGIAVQALIDVHSRKIYMENKPKSKANLLANYQYDINLKLLKKSEGYKRALKAADKQGLAAFNAAMAVFYKTLIGIKYKKAQTVLNDKANIGAYHAALYQAREDQKLAHSTSIEGTK